METVNISTVTDISLLIASITSDKDVNNLLVARFILSSQKHISLGEVGECTFLTLLFFELFKEDERKSTLKELILLIVERAKFDLLCSRDTAGNTPLHYAAMASDSEITRALFDRSIKPESNVLNRLPLYYTTDEDIHNLYKVQLYSNKSVSDSLTSVASEIQPKAVPGYNKSLIRKYIDFLPGILYISIITLCGRFTNLRNLANIELRIKLNKKRFTEVYSYSDIFLNKVVLKLPVDEEIKKLEIKLIAQNNNGTIQDLGVGVFKGKLVDEYNKLTPRTLYLKKRFSWLSCLMFGMKDPAHVKLSNGVLPIESMYIPTGEHRETFTTHKELMKHEERMRLRNYTIYSGRSNILHNTKPISSWKESYVNMDGCIVNVQKEGECVSTMDILDTKYTFTNSESGNLILQTEKEKIELVDKKQNSGVVDFLSYLAQRKADIGLK